VNCKSIVSILLACAFAGTIQAADTYKIDPAHTTVGFSISHMVINDVKGRFKEFEGTVVVDADDGNAIKEARAVIQTKSIDTDIAKRDDHLRSADFFDAAKYPTITFESTKVEKKSKEQVLTGKFTMHGVTKEISLPVTVKGPIKDPWGNTRIALKARTSLNRKDYGLTWNQVLEAGGLLVGEDVEIEINAEAVMAEPPKK
jgi:polyisoprenoid-binding protein YceI